MIRQLDEVLYAVSEGFSHAFIIADVTGLSRNTVSACLAALSKSGLIKRVGIADKAEGRRRGRDIIQWEPSA